MAITLYEYQKAVNVGKLEEEIHACQDIVVGVHSIVLFQPNSLKIYMKGPLSQDEQTALAGVVSNHVNSADPASAVQPVNIHEVPEYATDIELSYFKQTFGFDVEANQASKTVPLVTFPYSIAMRGGAFRSKAAWAGDKFKIEIAPRAIVGQLVADVAQGSKQIVVNGDCALYYIWKSDIIELTSDPTGNGTFYSMGRLVSKNGTTANMELEAPQAFTASPATYVAVTTQVTPEFEIDDVGDHINELGFVHRSMYVPANVPIIVTWTNTTMTAKRVVVQLEWFA